MVLQQREALITLPTALAPTYAVTLVGTPTTLQGPAPCQQQFGSYILLRPGRRRVQNTSFAAGQFEAAPGNSPHTMTAWLTRRACFCQSRPKLCLT